MTFRFLEPSLHSLLVLMNVPYNIESITVELDLLAKPTSLVELFPSPGPIELEVGIGKGAFLLEQAKTRPAVNFFGIEWANEYFRFAADRYARWGLTNVRLLRADARDFIHGWLADACLDSMHVYFPDPWPKKRHHKRRFFNPQTVEHIVRVLKPGGRLYVATDHAEYFEVIRPLLLARGELGEINFPDDFARPGELVGTNFERKYAREGRQFYKMAVEKGKPSDGI